MSTIQRQFLCFIGVHQFEYYGHPSFRMFLGQKIPSVNRVFRYCLCCHTWQQKEFGQWGGWYKLDDTERAILEEKIKQGEIMRST